MNDTHGLDGGRDELDLYIDGLLDAEQSAAFERRLFTDPELAAELARQRSLDGRLVAAFPVPEDPAAIAQQALAGPPTRHAGGRMLTFTRVAVAASVLVALGLWGPGFFDQKDSDAVDTQELTLGGTSCMSYGGLYAELVEESRQLLGACNVPHDFELHFQDTYGQELFVDATGAMSLEGPFTSQRWPSTTILSSPQQPEPILILVDAVTHDPKPVLEADSPAHLFRRELGSLVLYELSPWDKPQMLDLFRLQ